MSATLSVRERLQEGAFVDAGAGSVLEEAFDDAVTTAAYEYGHSSEVPSVALYEEALGEGRVTLHGSVPLPATLAHAAVREHLHSETLTPGVVYAQALAPEAAFRRRRANLRFDDPTLPVGEEIGALPLTPALLAEVRSLLQSEGVLVEDDEHIEEVDLRRVRARYKPVASAHPGRNRNEFVVTVRGEERVLATGATAGAARRAAMELLKQGGVDGNPCPVLEVSLRARRDDDSPIATVVRERVAQKGALKVSLAKEKNPEKRRTTGYLFYGVSAPTSAGTSAGETPEDTPPTDPHDPTP